MKVFGLGLALFFVGLFIGAFEPALGVLVILVSVGFIATGCVQLNRASGQRQTHSGGRRDRGWAAGGAAAAGTYGSGDSGSSGSSCGGGGGGGCGGGGGGGGC
ncbi:hypothetical protein ACFWF3_00175 [Nocardia sp. NPDC060220]|uniref:hypothetical protein n=1 Tax=Nocardia sp. NPDC060220 TaxID=3347076 RepID=UPI003659C999